MATSTQFEILVGEHWRLRTETYQVTSVEPERIQLRSLSRPNHILIHHLHRLYQSYRKGNLVKVQEAPFEDGSQRIISALDDVVKRETERRLGYVRGAEVELGGRLPRKATEEFIKHLANRDADPNPPCYTTLYEWSKSYRLAGGNPISLIPVRRRTRKLRITRQLAVVQEQIDYWVTELYFQDTPVTVTELTDVIISSLEDLNERRPINEQVRIPSKTTLWRIIQEIDFYEKELHQKGKRLALIHQHWSRASSLVHRVLERIEGDTQKMDVIVHGRGGEVLGRPYLTLFLDIKSRCVNAFDISLNPPCIEKTLRALKNGLMAGTPYAGLGQCYVLDNGNEFAGKKLAEVMNLLGAHIIFCEPYTPNQKPHVERWFKTLNLQFSHHLSGTTFSNPDDRGDYDPAEHTVYTLDELKLRFEEFLEVYHHNFHRSLNDSPHNTWLSSLDRFSPPRLLDAKDVQRLMLSKRYAATNGDTIGFEKLRWTAPGIRRLAQRSVKRQKLCIFYDISDLEKVTVCHPSWPDELITAEAVDMSYQANLTLEMHHLVQQELRLSSAKFDFKTARRARVKLVLALHSDKSKRGRQRQARLEENGSTSQPAPLPQPIQMAKLDRPPTPNFPEITLVDSVPIDSATTVEVRNG
ncbi:DDE-type integrase/transposase/recombinase [Pseudomonas bohemica]|uniref:DDE-type integrase/transposase/recombinase n=1 Tax=Pseudomonas bohemica TaxID=2044872 RepID=UPI0018FE91AE|nr:DDE-type integrase/transposase/recombinase [Pseudomonas bohemica]